MNLRTRFASFAAAVRPRLIHAWRPRWPRVSEPTAASGKDAPQLPPALAAKLEVLRRRHRRAALIGGFALALGLACTFLVFQGAADWWFGLPWLARASLLVIDLGALAWVYWCLLHHPLRLPLATVDIARLIERRWPQLGQSLLTAAELAEGGALTTTGSPQLAACVLADADQRAARLDLGTVVPLRRTRLAAAGAAIALILTLMIALLDTNATVALLKRMALLNTPRPTRTAVEPITGNLVVGTGDEVKLSARATRMHPAKGRVELTLASDAASGFALDAEETEPRIFSVTVPGAQKSYRYQFALGDGRGAEYTVTVKDPPVVTELTCEAIHPPYTKLPPKQLDPAAVEILAGSQMIIRATASTPLRSATVVLRGVKGTIPITLDSTGTRFEATVPIPAKDLDGWALHLVDKDGVESRNDTIYPLQILPDNVPKLSWSWPRVRRMTITPRAQTDWTVKAQDDFGFGAISLLFRAVPLEELQKTTALHGTRTSTFPLEPAPADHLFRQKLDFAAHPDVWQPGNIVEYWAEARDNNDVTGPGIAITRRQALFIITPEEKIAELHDLSRNRAGALDDLARRFSRDTSEIEEALLRNAPPPPPPVRTPPAPTPAPHPPTP